MPNCDACDSPMKRIRLSNTIYWVCTNSDCEYWKGTPDLPPHPCDDLEAYKEER